MKNAFLGLVLCALLIPTSTLGQENGTPLSLKTTKDQASYAIGLNIGRDIKSNGAEINAEALIQGIRDVLANAEPKLSEEQAHAALAEFQKAMQTAAEAQRRLASEKNKKEGELFLASNKDKEGIVTLPSGLQYKILKEGAGGSPKSTDTVTTHYHGTLIDGTVFDSSVEREEPVSFPVSGVIRGWTEALQLMKVGAKWRLYIPSELAYGTRGAGATIGPNSVLIFDVELLEIQ